jgi:hypothetical protein
LEVSVYAKTIPDREYQVAIKNGEIKDKFQKEKIEYKSDWQCRYCSYANNCWKEELIKYKNFDNSIELQEKDNLTIKLTEEIK